MTREVVVTNKNGLHARPSCALAKKVKEFDAKVTIRSGNNVVEACDVLQILSLGATLGTKMTLEAEGRQAEEVLDALEVLFKNNFDVTYN